MSNYGTHYNIAKKAGGAVALVWGLVTLLTTFDWMWTVAAIAVGYYATVIGGVAPDIDQSQPRRTFKYASIPYKKLVRLLGFLGVLTVLLIGGRLTEQGITIAEAILSIAGLVGIITLVRLIPDFLHGVMPSHRGILHDLAFWLPMSAGVGVGAHLLLRGQGYPLFVQTYLPVILATGTLTGVITHVSTDFVATFVKTSIQPRLPWTPRRLPPLVDAPVMLWVLIRPKTPWSIRALIVFTMAYFLLPVDIIPDFLLVLGWGDDLALYWVLREHIYLGYREGLTVMETLERELLVLSRIIFPALLLAALAAIGFVVYIL